MAPAVDNVYSGGDWGLITRSAGSASIDPDSAEPGPQNPFLGPRTKDQGRTKDHGRTKNQVPSTKD
jgi:hypothetical protein